jgi:hypothetical protein
VSNITFQVIDVHFLEWLVPALEPSVPCLNQPARGLFSGEAKNKVCYFGVIRGCLKIRILQQNTLITFRPTHVTSPISAHFTSPHHTLRHGIWDAQSSLCHSLRARSGDSWM